MSTRKKATKKSPSRPAKAIKRSAKSASSSGAKHSAKTAKPAKKIAAKAAKTSTTRRAAAPAKAKASRAKTSRVAVKVKSSARAKAAAAAKTRKPARVAAPAAKPKDQKILNAAKKKTESVKKGRDHLATVAVAPVQAKAPHAHVVESAKPREPSKPVAPAAPAVAESVAAPRPAKPAVAEKPPAAPAPEETVAQKAAKSANPRQGFKTSEFIVYPAHGVGQIVAVEEQEVAGFRLELFVITFVKDKMTLRVPTAKVVGVGMRKLAEPEVVKKALDILLGRARVKRTMWSRRAQEYESKINSGDLAAIAEVVRDLYRSDAQPEQSYSERQLYEAALDRLAREVAVVQKLSEAEALKAIDAQLQRGQRRGVKAAGEAGAAGAGGETDVEEAA